MLLNICLKKRNLKFFSLVVDICENEERQLYIFKRVLKQIPYHEQCYISIRDRHFFL